MIVVRIYRLARWLHLRHVPGLPWILKSFVRIVFGLVLPPSAQVGRNVLFSYEGLGTVVHRKAIIEDDAIIGTGVTIGGRAGVEQVPTIGQGAMIGSGAKILGPVRVGRYAAIGANAVVLSDIPDYAVAVGVPARVVRINQASRIPDYRRFSES